MRFLPVPLHQPWLETFFLLRIYNPPTVVCEDYLAVFLPVVLLLPLAFLNTDTHPQREVCRREEWCGDFNARISLWGSCHTDGAVVGEAHVRRATASWLGLAVCDRTWRKNQKSGASVSQCSPHKHFTRILEMCQFDKLFTPWNSTFAAFPPCCTLSCHFSLRQCSLLFSPLLWCCSFLYRHCFFFLFLCGLFLCLARAFPAEHFGHLFAL